MAFGYISKLQGLAFGFGGYDLGAPQALLPHRPDFKKLLASKVLSSKQNMMSYASSQTAAVRAMFMYKHQELRGMLALQDIRMDDRPGYLLFVTQDSAGSKSHVRLPALQDTKDDAVKTPFSACRPCLVPAESLKLAAQSRRIWRLQWHCQSPRLKLEAQPWSRPSQGCPLPI